LLISEGDKFTVIFKGGNLKPLVNKADFTLSFDSLILVLIIPTIVKVGNPFVKVDSTSIHIASMVSKEADFNIFISLPIII